jgi:hypothetical protein
MRIAGDIQLDGLNIVFDQASGTATTLLAGAPAGNITLNLPITADTLVGRATTDTLTNKTINASNNTISNLTVAMLAAGVLNTSATLTGATDSQVPSALAAKDYADSITSTGLALKADKTTTMTAGTGLTGGGDLSANRTFNIANTAVTLGSYGSATAVGTFTVDQQGRLTAAADVAIQIAQSQVTNLVTDLSNKASSSITITAGTGLSGGGDLTANRTLNIANTGVIATGYGGASSSISMNVNAQGQITSASTVSIQIAESQVTNLVTDLGNKQPLDATLTALAGYNTNGILAQTATDTFAGRTIAGTANRVVVTNGDGVAGNPTLDIGTDVVTLTGSQTLSNKVLTYVDTETESGTISANAITPAKGLYRITGGGTTLDTLTGTNDGQQVVIFNNSGADITVTNAGNIQTGTGANFTFKNGAATSLAYSSSASKWLLSGGAGGGGLATSLKTTTFTAAAGNHYLCSTSSGAYTATLPAGSTGSVIRFSDDARTWANTNLTIAPASGESIDGLAANETLVCDLTGAFVQLMWNGTKWVIDTNGYAAAITSGSLSSAQGMGAKNYIGNPNNATNWVASDAGILIATESTIANLPANSTQTSGIRITRVSGTTSYDRYRFTLDVADYSKKFAISFDQKYAGAAGDYTLAVFSNTLADYTGTSTQLTLQTSSISALNGSFNTTVDMPGASAPYIEVRIIAAAGTTPLYLNNVYVGPGIITQGAAISDAVTFTPSSPNTSFGTIGTSYMQYRRVGANMHISGRVRAGTPAGSEARIALPLGTIGAVGGSSTLAIAGKWTNNTATGSTLKQGVIQATPGLTYLTFGAEDTGSATNPTTALNASSIVGTSGDLYFNAECIVPIAEWAGNGTVNLGAGAQVELAASTNGTWDAAATAANTVYGPAGAPMTGALATVSRSKIVRFQYPIQSDDMISLELASSASGPWQPVETFADTSGLNCFPFSFAATAAADTAGVEVRRVSGVSTDVEVIFQKRSWARGDASAYRDWQNGWFWRVRKARASSPVGFGLAGTDGSSGLYKAGQAPGLVTGATIASGYVGEDLTPATSTTNPTTSNANLTSQTLTAGKWMLTAITKLDSAAGYTYFGMSISSTSATPDADSLVYAAPASGLCSATTVRIVNIPSSTTYYVVGAVGTASITGANSKTRLFCVRIA